MTELTFKIPTFIDFYEIKLNKLYMSGTVYNEEGARYLEKIEIPLPELPGIWYVKYYNGSKLILING